MISGTVMWFDPERGVGGIVVDGSGDEVSVWSSEIDGGGMQSLRPQDRVRLTVHHGSSGSRATRVWTP